MTESNKKPQTIRKFSCSDKFFIGHKIRIIGQDFVKKIPIGETCGMAAIKFENIISIEMFQMRIFHSEKQQWNGSKYKSLVIQIGVSHNKYMIYVGYDVDENKFICDLIESIEKSSSK
jgi:hypothetical protein